MNYPNTPRHILSEEALTDVYFEQGSKDAMTGAVIGRIALELKEFGVSTTDIAFHLTEQSKRIKE